MGLLGSIADGIGDVVSTAADIAPIPGSDAVASGIDAVQEVAGGSSEFDLGGAIGGGGGRSQRPQLPMSPHIQGGGRDSTGVSIGGSVPGLGSMQGSFSRVTEGSGQASGQASGQNLPMGGGFQGAIMMELLEESISGRDGRAVLEAMTSGALQNGVIQRPANVQTPRGTRNVSPPGFRTVYLGGDDDQHAYAVFKPLARSLGLIGRESPKTFREKLDDTTREFLKHRSEFQDLAKKLGLKTSTRKSGPSR